MLLIHILELLLHNKHDELRRTIFYYKLLPTLYLYFDVYRIN